MLWELTWIHISLFSQTFGLEKLSATSCQDNPLFSIFKTFNVGNWWSPFSRWSIRPNTNLWISLYNTSVRTVSNFTSLQSMMWSLVRKLWGNLPNIESPDTKKQKIKLPNTFSLERTCPVNACLLYRSRDCERCKTVTVIGLEYL